MAAEPKAINPQPEAWNYFNYFTEVEEHFQRARGTGLFLLSPLDWTLVEGWKNSGVPLEAVLRGIDAAFQTSRTRRTKHQTVNSVAYCTQAIHKEAEAIANGSPAVHKPAAAPPFELAELCSFLTENARILHGRQEFCDIESALLEYVQHAEGYYSDLEQLEQRLTALEDKMSAIVRAAVSDEELFQLRRELDSAMRAYRRKMTADQIAMVERQYLDRQLREKAGLPRLSLFYLK